jgi:hypothetical protein
MSTRKQATREVRSITTSADGTAGSAIIGHGTRDANGTWAIKLTCIKAIEQRTCVRRREVVEAPGT